MYNPDSKNFDMLIHSSKRICIFSLNYLFYPCPNVFWVLVASAV